ncbi:MAG: hypothetical protein ABIG37_02185 [Nanoarchaeota archaeon]|nr:hypothetical protein [Nanoarchaeota archaeon]
MKDAYLCKMVDGERVYQIIVAVDFKKKVLEMVHTRRDSCRGVDDCELQEDFRKLTSEKGLGLVECEAMYYAGIRL